MPTNRPDWRKQKRRYNRLTVRRVMVALKHCNGVVRYVAKRLGVRAESLHNFMRNHPELREEAQRLKFAHRDRLLELALNKLERAVRKGEQWAIERVLDTAGAEDGWRPEKSSAYRLQVTGPETWRAPLTDRQQELLVEAIRTIDGDIGYPDGGGAPLTDSLCLSYESGQVEAREAPSTQVPLAGQD